MTVGEGTGDLEGALEGPDRLPSQVPSEDLHGLIGQARYVREGAVLDGPAIPVGLPEKMAAIDALTNAADSSGNMNRRAELGHDASTISDTSTQRKP
jgi:hypothetical protein